MLLTASKATGSNATTVNTTTFRSDDMGLRLIADSM
jgi:hypothetical protein